MNIKIYQRLKRNITIPFVHHIHFFNSGVKRFRMTSNVEEINLASEHKILRKVDE